MHVQARAKTAASPEDLEKFLTWISDPEQLEGRPAVNVEGVSGSHVEHDGEFVFSFDHDRVDEVRHQLRDYNPTFLYGVMDSDEDLPPDRDGTIFWARLAENTPGQLLAAIQAARNSDIGRDKEIRDVMIGQETGGSQFYVQITFED